MNVDEFNHFLQNKRNLIKIYDKKLMKINNLS